MIELARLTEENYKTEVAFKMPDGTVEKTPVIYRPITTGTLKELDAIRADPKKGAAHQAALLVRELPELTKEGQPIGVGLTLFEAMDARHVNAIVLAITNDFYEVKPEEVAETKTA